MQPAEKNLMEDNRVGCRSAIGTQTFDPRQRPPGQQGRGRTVRPERQGLRGAFRNRLLNNRVTDSGGEESVAIDVQGETEAVQFIGNELRETRSASASDPGPKTADIT
jgi:hypothetical protein